MKRLSHRRLCRAAVVVVAVSSLAGCSSGKDDGGGGGSTKTASADSGPIVLGQASGQSGWLTAYDGPASQGARIAMDEINAKGGINGRKLKLVSADHQSDANLALRAGQEVLDEGAQILLASCNYEHAAPVARLANSKKQVVFSYCAGEPLLTRQSGDANRYTFDMGNETNGVGASMATFAHAKGWRKAYVLGDTTSNYTRQMCEFATDAWKGLDGTSVVGTDTFKNDDASVAGQIANIKSKGSKADFIFFCSTLPGAATAVRQIRSAGIDLPIVTGDGMDSPAVTKAIPKLSDFYESVSASVYGDDPDPKVNEFFANFQKRTGKKPDGSYALMGYSIVYALQKAIEDAGTTDGPKLMAALESFDKVQLPIGPMTFNAEQHVDPKRPEKIIGFTRGKPAYVQTVEPASVPDPF
jgi:branched-chain amino acid transport system substrate-binding protein